MVRRANTSYLISFTAEEVLHRITTAVVKSVGESRRAFYDAFQSDLGPGIRAKINAHAVELGQQAALESYDRTVGNNGHFSYTRQTRYGGGALRRAIASERFVSSDANSVEFGDVPLLDQKAKQWARLNYGAGSLGEGSALLHATASPAFSVPEGYFREGKRGERVGRGHRGSRSYTANFQPGRRGQDAFFPQLRGAPVRMWPTRGIKARHFLDDGVRALAQAVHNGYIEQLDKFQKNTKEGVSRAAKRAET